MIAPGINRAFETWGHFLTALAGKKRPANDADFSLKHLGYWTDHGAQYYYRFEETLGYIGTLLKVRDQFRDMNIKLGTFSSTAGSTRKDMKASGRAQESVGRRNLSLRGVTGGILSRRTWCLPEATRAAACRPQSLDKDRPQSLPEKTCHIRQRFRRPAPLGRLDALSARVGRSRL